MTRECRNNFILIKIQNLERKIKTFDLKTTWDCSQTMFKFKNKLFKCFINANEHQQWFH